MKPEMATRTSLKLSDAAHFWGTIGYLLMGAGSAALFLYPSCWPGVILLSGELTAFSWSIYLLGKSLKALKEESKILEEEIDKGVKKLGELMK